MTSHMFSSRDICTSDVVFNHPDKVEPGCFDNQYPNRNLLSIIIVALYENDYGIGQAVPIESTFYSSDIIWPIELDSTNPTSV